MKIVLLTIVLLFGVGVINAHVRKETFQNLFVKMLPWPVSAAMKL